MVIFVSKNSETTPLDSTSWEDEKQMQNYILKNSEIIFSKFLNGVKICPIGRELYNGNGYADFVFLDQEGSLYVVEAKLDSNSDKRKIFAQVTGYVSAIRSQSTTQSFDDFIISCEQSIKKQLGFSETFDKYIQEKFKIDQNSVYKIKSTLENNIREQSVFCIIMMDIIDNELKLDIDSHQIDSKNRKICGVELQKYEIKEDPDSFLVVPHYYGIEKLHLNEKNDSEYDKTHVKGWNFFNDEIQKNTELDQNTKKNILKLTDSLENIPYSGGWMRLSNKKLETFFKKFGDYDYFVLNIYQDGTLNFHIKSPFKDDLKLGQDFRSQLSNIDPIIENELKSRTDYYSIKPELWIPKVDEFIALFEKFYS